MKLDCNRLQSVVNPVKQFGINEWQVRVNQLSMTICCDMYLIVNDNVQ